MGMERRGKTGCPARLKGSGAAPRACGVMAAVRRLWSPSGVRPSADLPQSVDLSGRTPEGIVPFPGDLPSPGTGPPPLPCRQSPQHWPRRVSFQSDRNPHRGHCSGPVRNGPSVSHTVVKLKILKKSWTETFWAYTAQDLSLWAVLPAP